ncbi:isoleucine--tRNA ligase [[Mycoplasma] testudinis]|uniref:isoleucine--tRNA ligase n=1 Tax=[Mycoplasma] testudinis TaxID=33924 RepID=UPI000561DAF5|nr:isoleucine--tRNA ligase [[Mycoplasma] testudinis]
MDFKQTLITPKTEFDMKANLAQKEPLIQAQWLEKKVYQKRLEKNKSKPKKILHDGPPYANGNIHVGHSVNKILKDIIVRFWLSQGFYSEYIPGWDTHGLPIEHAISVKTENYNSLSVQQKRDLCLQFAKEQIAIQKNQFSKLGLATDFSKCYYTFEPEFEARQLNVFKKMVSKGLIFQDLKPIYWSSSSKSALADAEVEYRNIKAPSVFVSFDVVSENHATISKGTKLLIWTTTPWTIPSNQAICVNPNFTYVLVDVANQKFVVEQSLLEKVAGIIGWVEYKVIKTISGPELENLKYQHPLYPQRICPVLLGNHVTNDDGSGLVHTAPGFGMDDFLVCKKYGIKELLVPIDDAGCFDTSLNDSELAGKFYLDANKDIGMRLEKLGHLHSLKFIEHTEAHDWRTKKPVMYRATKQWFVNLEKIHKDIREALKNVEFQSEIYRKRIADMVTSRPEWCISRQRVWGIPIPIIYDENNDPIMDSQLIQNIINLLSKHGINAWFDKPASFFLTKKYDQNKKYTKEQDIMDVWFDSGSSWNVLERNGLGHRAHMYLEGNDQYRGWFNSSLICSVIVNNVAPYKQLVSHGFTLDEKGLKMSKSVGNVIDPLAICQEYGADVLRLWVCSIYYNDDHRIGKNILSQVVETYRKIRNTLFRFILSNLNDFDFKPINEYELSLADHLVIHRVNVTLDKIDEAFEKYDFLNVVRLMNKQVIELSTWYFELIKDSLYCNPKDNVSRKAIQATLNYIFEHFLIRLAPILPHTCEEAYSFYQAPKKLESVLLCDYPSKIKMLSSVNLDQLWKDFSALKDEVFAKTELARNQKIFQKNNEAKVVLSKKYETLKPFLFRRLKTWLNVAEVELSNQNDILVTKSEFKRCDRCWTHYSDSEFANDKICKRCHNVIKAL